MSSVVSLTVHKNTLAKKRARHNADVLLSEAKAERHSGDTAGFALVTWDAAGSCNTTLQLPAGSPVDLNLVESFVAGAIRRKVAKIDTRNDIYGEETED